MSHFAPKYPICSKTKLGSELDRIRQLLIENAYPEDVLFSCIKQELANFAAENPFGAETCPFYLKLHQSLKTKLIKP